MDKKDIDQMAALLSGIWRKSRTALISRSSDFQFDNVISRVLLRFSKYHPVLRIFFSLTRVRESALKGTLSSMLVVFLDKRVDGILFPSALPGR